MCLTHFWRKEERKKERKKEEEEEEEEEETEQTQYVSQTLFGSHNNIQKLSQKIWEGRGQPGQRFLSTTKKYEELDRNEQFSIL